MARFRLGISFGSRYVKVNQVLLALRDELATDLWTLDSLWWFLDEEDTGALQDGAFTEALIRRDEEIEVAAEVANQRFGLERHLHDFLRDNWNALEIAQQWALYSEPGDDEAGYEYPTEVGRIDLLARHKSEPRWLVIELKRQSSADQTLAQLLRYMGWVQRHLAKPEEQVEGMIICRDTDKRLPYALEMVPNVALKTYEVEFQLKDLTPGGLGS